MSGYSTDIIKRTQPNTYIIEVLFINSILQYKRGPESRWTSTKINIFRQRRVWHINTCARLNCFVLIARFIGVV